MLVDKRLLDILICPGCSGGIALAAAGLECQACGRVYPVRDGIPVMLVDQSTPPTEVDPA